MSKKKFADQAVREFRRVIARAIAIRHLKQHRSWQVKVASINPPAPSLKK